VVAWRVSEDETETLRRFGRFLREAMPRAGSGELDWPAELDGDGPLTGVTDTYHPMGGLPMGIDPAQSVVDPELRVHGIANLAVASCAVFPAGGSSNPTFTLMALTLRLADRLAKELRGSP
jgi:choline dehydrogenase-like flavoprotein